MDLVDAPRRIARLAGLDHFVATDRLRAGLGDLEELAALAAPGDELPESPRVLVFGVGTQGRSSILATRAAFPTATFEVIGRRPERVDALTVRWPSGHEQTFEDVPAGQAYILVEGQRLLPIAEYALP